MRLQKFLYLYLALWLAFPCIVIIIWMMDYNLLIGTTGTAFRIQGILNCIAAVCGITLAFLHYRETEKALKNKITLAAIAAGTAFLLLFLRNTTASLHQTEYIPSLSWKKSA